MNQENQSRISRKAVLAALFFMTVVAGACSNQEETQAMTGQELTATDLKKATIPVEGMTCNACVASVKKKLKSMDGVQEVQVSLQDRNVTFSYAPSEVSPVQVREAINEIGYKAGEPEAEGEVQ